VRATELYQEGLIIPPIRICEGGQENAMLFDLIRANVRQPDIMIGDLRAQEAALLKGEQRLGDLLDRYGSTGVTEAMEMLIAYSERKTRAAIAAIPNGSYEFEDYMDHDGFKLNKPVKIKCRLEVFDDCLRFDFTGTDPQVQGPINATMSLTWTTVFVCVSCILPDDVPFNEGMTRTIEVHAPDGAIINPRHPAPVNVRSVTLQRIVDAVLGAPAQAVPERFGAQSCGVVVGVSFGGVDPRTGKNFVFYEAYSWRFGRHSFRRRRGWNKLRRGQSAEYPRRSGGNELSDTHTPLRTGARFRRQRRVSRWPGTQARVRDARGNGNLQCAWRALCVRAARFTRLWQRQSECGLP